jgi:ABC-type uncharacterized transport system involved in gliding motility auxiliary subunit
MKFNSKSALAKASGGAIGLAAVGAIIVAVNVILSNVGARVDLTEEKLYTLSEGTVSLLDKLDQPVTLKLYFSSSSPRVPSQLKTFAKQVEDLLREYRGHSNGHITIEKHDPRPDSDAEEWAQKYGVAPQQVEMFGNPMYLGLVAVSGDEERVIPAFDPSQEQLLEYNITRLIYRLMHPEKPVLGVISSIPIMGAQQPPAYGMPPQQPQQQPWVAIQTIRRDYDLRELTPPVTEVSADIKALVIVHPKDLDDGTLFAIDQFVLRGGHVMMMVDPLSIADQPPQQMPGRFNMPDRSSDAQKLFAAWGVGYAADQVVADRKAATNLRMQNNQIEQSFVALTLVTNNISRSEILTAQLDAMTLPYAGYFSDRTADDLTFTPLLFSSDDSGTVNSRTAQFGAAAVQREYKDSAVRLNMAVRLSGSFRTAFPEGHPDRGEESEDAEKDVNLLAEGTSTVILVGDVDLIFDPVCVEEVNMFGFRQHRARNDNLSFFANAVELAAGSQDLVAIRSRGRHNRPFGRVMALQAAAMREQQGRQVELEDKLREAQGKLQELQAGKGSDQQFILSPEQQEAIANFRKEEVRVRKELKEVRKSLRRDVEHLGVWVKVINIALMPLLVSIAGVTFGLYRRKHNR